MRRRWIKREPARADMQGGLVGGGWGCGALTPAGEERDGVGGGTAVKRTTDKAATRPSAPAGGGGGGAIGPAGAGGDEVGKAPSHAAGVQA